MATDLTATHLWLVLFKAAKAVERNALDSISGLGLGLSDFAILELLLHKGPQPVNLIGRKVLLSSGSITTAIDRLAARKLVQRTANPDDLRSRLVELTPAGRKLIEPAFNKHCLDMEQTMSILRPRERQKLVRLLRKLGLHAESISDQS